MVQTEQRAQADLNTVLVTLQEKIKRKKKQPYKNKQAQSPGYFNLNHTIQIKLKNIDIYI